MDVGAPLAALNSGAIVPGTGSPFRLRMLLHVGVADLSQSAGNFKLQFAQQSGTCDTGFVGESYADVTAGTVIGYYDNAIGTDGMNAAANLNDPVHGSDNIALQTYEEANNLTNSISAIPVGEDGLWDYALFDNSAPSSTTYCLRIVYADGSLLNTYSFIPEITTAP